MTIALTNGLLIDGTGKKPLENTTVIIDGEEIVEVTDRPSLGSEVDVIDLGGKAILPGLIDCHIHFALWTLDLLAHQDQSIPYLTAGSFSALAEALAAGCTSARDPGGLEAGFRDAVNEGLALGPRLQTSVTMVSPVNGIMDATSRQGLASPQLPGMPRPECSGPHEARAKVREVLRSGADFIKIATTGGVSSLRVDPRQQLFTREEVDAIVGEAHAWGVPVICHALGGPGLLMAVHAGVDTIEHGGWLDEECVNAMADRGTWYVPTFAVYHWHSTIGPEFKQARAKAMHKSHLGSFELARERGVRIAMGSDAGGYGHDFSLELELLVAAGMTPAEAIVAATSRAAECLGWSDETGTIAPHKKADLVVVQGDPTKDISLLRGPDRLSCVLKSGRPAVDRIGIESFA